jgi:hypothetical protein
MDTLIRFGYATFGTLALALGLVGLVLPVMPSTVFLIVAAWAFARSVPSVHRWLHTNPWFGPALRRWERERCMDRATKRLASAMIALSALASGMALADRPVLVLALLATLGGVLVYVNTRATCPARGTRS